MRNVARWWPAGFHFLGGVCLLVPLLWTGAALTGCSDPESPTFPPGTPTPTLTPPPSDATPTSTPLPTPTPEGETPEPPTDTPQTQTPTASPIPTGTPEVVTPTPMEPTPTPQADIDQDGFYADEDCNDEAASIHPGADEVCDGIDNNCDEQVDEGVQQVYYADLDHDGVGGSTVVTACSLPSGASTITGDCRDTNDTISPNAVEKCNGTDDNCNDQVDEGVTTTYYQDSDGDGYGASNVTTQDCSLPPGYAGQPGDCRDTNDTINPGAAELCNAGDDDCDGLVDEGVTKTYFRDQDQDGFGTSSTTTQACTVPSGYAEVGGDCLDTHDASYPGAVEQCDGLDNDCNGQVDEGLPIATFYQDVDGDGYGNGAVTTQGCRLPPGYSTSPYDCNDTRQDVYPGALEVCNHVDDDCDGGTDEGVSVTYFRDSDNDGFGTSGATTKDCSVPTGYTSISGDCDDSVPTIHPGAIETCNYRDDDCDGSTDEGVSITYYKDNDLDGYGSATNTTQACSQPTGFVSTGTDCNDFSSSTHPNALENCSDSTDQDCSGTNNGVDPSCQITGYALTKAPDCGSYCYYDELHNLNVSGSSANNSGFAQYAFGQLTDGGKGADNVLQDLGQGPAYEWVGWNTEDPSVYFRFGARRTFSQVVVGMSNYGSGGIGQCRELQVFFSNDGTNFDNVEVFSTSAGTLPTIPSGKRADITLNVSGNTGIMAYFYCFRNAQWSMLDEISFK